MKVVYKTITTAGSSIVVPVTSTLTLTLTSTKVVKKTSAVTIEKVKTATETKEIVKTATATEENTVTKIIEKPVTYTVVETKVVPTTTVEVVTTVVPTGRFPTCKLTSNPLIVLGSCLQNNHNCRKLNRCSCDLNINFDLNLHKGGGKNFCCYHRKCQDCDRDQGDCQNGNGDRGGYQANHD